TDPVCEFILKFLNPSHTLSFSGITGFSNLRAQMSNTNNQNVYTFTVVAHGSSGQTEVLWGESCYPISNCEVCDPNDVNLTPSEYAVNGDLETYTSSGSLISDATNWSSPVNTTSAYYNLGSSSISNTAPCGQSNT